MIEIPHSENKQIPLWIFKSLQVLELFKMLREEVNSFDGQLSLTSKPKGNDNKILDDFIEQCFDNASNDINSPLSSFLEQIDQDHYTTKRGNGCSFQNGLKVFKCKECQADFSTPQKLGTHTSKMHLSVERKKKQIKKI
ncbi:unnamed protein product (macronuclear) [Paramecium tetraurelia]|uniref:C2H2-type domain-containing protein n=1 Tax=Paramecium tetraurelia TaxID=5888 RepID=A0DPX1_PARTE|nr:uncharacterized protein GSPATT00002487001 [Paramecium tetraurelia]CAK85088.1 unnamed protein product [Paramecium tetraurelia]|eukprot:XP_001452485.1 hypothetical protein (macronuclear) [Paramecium tetraurelia strain d4-2]